MWKDPDLEDHLRNSRAISGGTSVIAEWNMNDPENIAKVGNYRHRNPSIPSWATYDPDDGANLYTGGTDSDVDVIGDYDDYSEPTIFTTKVIKQKLLYSLDDCLKPHRPRSGINHLSYFSGRYIGGDNVSSERPRWYMNSYSTPFKYWTSFREEGGIAYGVGKPESDGKYPIDDVSPFVVYKNSVPTNKIVVKMQTGVGSVDIGEINTDSGRIGDPLFGFENSMVPRTWRIQTLLGTAWNTVIEFNEGDVRKDGSPIVDHDGYVELSYGLLIPDEYPIGTHRGNLSSSNNLPDSPIAGDYYYVIAGNNELGTVYIWSDDKWNIFVPTYGWKLTQDYANIDFGLTNLAIPDGFDNGGGIRFREFEYIDGMRIVVDTVNKVNDTFDLIEMSPRLIADLTDMVVNFSITKTLGKIDSTKIPVGDLSAGIGSVSIFDEHDVFKETNENSIISSYLDNDVSFYFYENIKNVKGADYRIPIKKLYTEGKEPKQESDHKVSYQLRDLFYMLEGIEAPKMLLTDVSLSYAVTVLLDSAGISNYVFDKADGASEPIMPYFFIPPDKNIAQVLKSLAVASQSAMFFDEYNNFVVMFKERLLPTEQYPHDVDLVLDGDSGIPNIKSIASQEKNSFNKGKITYTERYIQRTKGSLSYAGFTDWDTPWYYTPSLLWEATGDEMPRTINEKVVKESKYTLAAMPLDSLLPSEVPTVVDRTVINNVMEFGENVMWLSRYNGYFYSSGEIIRYDAVEYSVQGVGDVWIDSNDEYQFYASKLSWGGKMYPTGAVRIFTEPMYEKVGEERQLKNGDLKSHGRGQFDTAITSHSAGLPEYWGSAEALSGIHMKSGCLFQGEEPRGVTYGQSGGTSLETGSTRNGIIKNWLREVKHLDSEVKTYKTTRAGVVQSSALMFTGPKFSPVMKPRDFLSIVSKPLPEAYTHWGTRLRIVGKLIANADIDQEAVGGSEIYHYSGFGSNQKLVGGGGGIAVGLDSIKNTGYFFEMIALASSSVDELSQAGEGTTPHNIVFYKVGKNDDQNPDGLSIPVKLWGGMADIIVDDGTFVGQGRLADDDSSSVYDLSIEREQVSDTHSRFYLYINGNQVATVDDYDSLEFHKNVGLFVRGKSSVMFENLYALGTNVAEDRSRNVVSNGLSNTFGVEALSAGQYGRYAISGVVQDTYLTGIHPDSGNDYNMYYEEFGSIMREASYFDIRYDKAYPALLAAISPTFNNERSYTVSGFHAGSYGAQFLVFNAANKSISLDESTGNYLRIQGVTFTQSSARELSMDGYFEDVGNRSGSAIRSSGEFTSAEDMQDEYRDIKIDRLKRGDKEFTLTSEYIQTQDFAAELMKWLIDKTTRQRKQIGVDVFSTPTIQLGDIVSIQYSKNGVDLVAAPDVKFLVYNMTFKKDSKGPKTTVYLTEI